MTPTTAPLAKSALAYASRFDLQVIPIRPNSKKPPLLQEWETKATTDTATIADWWQRTPSANVGLVPTARQFVLDVDGEDGPATLRKLEAEHGSLPESWTATTASGGSHFWFGLAEGVRVPNRVRFAAGLDTRSAKGYVVAPPSIRPEGAYVWEVSPADVPLAMAPDWLVELVRARTEDQEPKTDSQGANGTHPKPEGCPERILRKLLEDAEEALATGAGRNDTFFRILTQARDNGASRKQAEGFAQDFLALCERHPRSDPYEPKEARDTIRSVFRKPAREPWEDSLDGFAIASTEAESDRNGPQEEHPDTTEGAPFEWKEPKPLDAEREVPPIPASILQAFPEWIRNPIAATAETFESAEDFGVLSALAALSFVGLGKVTTKSFARWRKPQPCNFFALTTAPPGRGKSETLDPFTGPLDEIESERLTLARRQFARDQAEREVRKKRQDNLKAKASNGDDSAMGELLILAEDGAEVEPIPPRHRVASQSTPEGIAELALANAGQFALLSAEPEALAQLLPSYREGPKLIPEVVTSGFDAKPFRQVRASAGKSREIPSVHGVVLILAQKTQLDRILTEPCFVEQGFISRCLVATPNLPPKKGRPWEGEEIPSHVAEEYRWRIVELGVWLLRQPGPGVICYSPEALEALKPLYQEMNVRRDCESGDLRPLASALIRVEQIAIRVGALVHLARHEKKAFEVPVEADVAEAVVDLARYHCEHAKALLAPPDPAVVLAAKILARATREGLRTDWRVIQQSMKRGAGWAKVEEALDLLEERHLARKVEEPAGPQGGRPRCFLDVNPALFEGVKA